MASKKTRPLDDPPAASSSEERVETEEEDEVQEEEIGSKPQLKETDAQEDEDSDEEVESADSDEEEQQQSDDENEEDDHDKKIKKNNNNKKLVNHKTPTPISGSTKQNPPPESSSESDSQKSPRASDFTIKPISASPETGTPVSKPSAPKRRAENGKSASKSSKKAKTETAVAGGEEEEEEEDGGGATTAEKKFAINRLWSEEDEIRILKGLLEFQSKLGKDVSTHNQEFHDFVKGSLHVDVTKNQLMDKVRRLKRKFKTNIERSVNGEDPSFAKPHELKSFQLCKKIWGKQSDDVKPSRSLKKTEKSKPVVPVVDANATPKTAPKEKERELVVKGKDDENESDDLGKLYPSLMAACQPVHMSNLPIPEFLKSNLSLIGSSELKELDSKWKKQNAAEMEVYLGRIDLLCEEARIALNAMKNNKN